MKLDDDRVPWGDENDTLLGKRRRRRRHWSRRRLRDRWGLFVGRLFRGGDRGRRNRRRDGDGRSRWGRRRRSRHLITADSAARRNRYCEKSSGPSESRWHEIASGGPAPKSSAPG